MARVITLLVGLCLVLQAFSQKLPPLTLKVGDQISVVVAIPDTPYGGKYTVMSDGAVYGYGFGRVPVLGKTWDEASTALKNALRPVANPKFVYVTVESHRSDSVYVVGFNGQGRVPIDPKQTLRQTLGGFTGDDWELLTISLSRGGKELVHGTAGDLFRGAAPGLDTELQPEDVILVLPPESIRVWVAGLVERPGMLKLPAGISIYDAVTAAGGLQRSLPTSGGQGALDGERKIVLRRGLEATEYPSVPVKGAPGPTMENGDVLTVLGPEEIRVTVGGMVNKPGEYVLRSDTSLLGAINSAGVQTDQASLQNVLVFRSGELLQFDASVPQGITTAPKLTHLEQGDIVYVQRNERQVYVLGESAKQGAVTLEEHKAYHLEDVYALAGGLNSSGSMRNIALIRPDASGRLQITHYNLDEYLKDGNLAANPEIRAGDTLYFGKPRGLSTSGVLQAVTDLILLKTIFRR